MINVTSSLYPSTLPPTHYHTLPPSHHHTLIPSHHHTLTLTPSATYTPSRDETSRCGSDAEAHSSLWGSAIGWRQHPPWPRQLQSLQVSPQSDSNSSIQWFSIHTFIPIKFILIPILIASIFLIYSNTLSPFQHIVSPVHSRFILVSTIQFNIYFVPPAHFHYSVVDAV